MGYVSTKTGPMQLNPSASRALMLQQRAGLGDTTTDILNSLTAPSTITGLPILWELGLGLLGAALILSWTGKGRQKYRSARRSRAMRAVRRARLKAELAAL